MRFNFEEIARKSVAKVNLIFKILSQRQDGYHNIESLMAKVDLADELLFRPLQQAKFTVICPEHPELEGNNNLILRAARLLVPAGKGLEVRLKKVAPIGGGMGGGSSNAATTLQVCQELFGLKLSSQEEFALGLKLGADVPFFLSNTPVAIATGIGDEITPLKKFPPLNLLLANPGFGVNTQWAYQTYAQNRQENPKFLTISHRNDKYFSFNREISQLSTLGLIEPPLARLMTNDLERVVVENYPEIAELSGAILKLGAMATVMSGSGATVFGLFANHDQATKASQQLEEKMQKICKHGSAWCKAVQTLACDLPT